MAPSLLTGDDIEGFWKSTTTPPRVRCVRLPSDAGNGCTWEARRRPKIAAIFSVVESCRRLAVPIRKYLADVLPGMANRSIRTLADLTPTAYVAKMAE